MPKSSRFENSTEDKNKEKNMEQIKSGIHPRKGKHLTQKERIMIETMLNGGL